MRITTNLLYDLNLRAIESNQGNLSQIQQQLATGKKLLKPSDDPVGASRLIRITEEIDKINQYQRNNDLVTNSLELQETALRSINDVVNRARVLVVQSGNGIFSSEDRKAIGAEIAQIRNQVLDLMNSQNSNGEFIFAGYQSSTQAFEFTPSAVGKKVTFAGDDGTNEIQISDSIKVQSSSSGKTIFEEVFARLNYQVSSNNGVTNVSTSIDRQQTFDQFHRTTFDTLNNANNQYRFEILPGDQVQISNLGTGAIIETKGFASGEPFVFEGMRISMDGGPGDSLDIELNRPEKKNLAETLNDMFLALDNEDIAESDFVNAIDDTLVGIDNGLEQLGLESSSIGARLNIAQSIKSSNLDAEVANTKARSSIEDVDYAEASSEFAKQETALQAAFQSFPRIANLSLFNFIS